MLLGKRAAFLATFALRQQRVSFREEGRMMWPNCNDWCDFFGLMCM